MVYISGLRPQSTFEQVAAEIELDAFRVKLPDRAAKFVLESPSLAQISPENEEDIIEFEKRKRTNDLRRSEIQRIAQERGVSRVLLEQHAQTSITPHLDLENDSFERRRYENSLRESAAEYQAATTRAGNVARVGDLLRTSLGEANRAQAHVRISDEADFFDISTPPPEPNIDLHTPSVPRRLADGTVSLAANTAGLAALAVPAVGAVSIETLAEAARLTQMYGPSVARATMRAAGVSASALANVVQGLARGGHATGSAAGHAVAAAGNVLAAAAPVHNHRGRDFQRSQGVQFVGRVAHGILARHAIH